MHSISGKSRMAYVLYQAAGRFGFQETQCRISAPAAQRFCLISIEG